ncbi:hypothetical protein ONZ43_g5249 [Nemania bipapillata]|uniref:Uncharacterized protein n=1 Tax=Nemania bipapillata TaxID=110536 RepID=A0ACC2ICZ0_9PEZI|nr:hypothetical protein ONZ43_g5249 [Nemania bipapillata]
MSEQQRQAQSTGHGSDDQPPEHNPTLSGIPVELQEEVFKQLAKIPSLIWAEYKREVDHQGDEIIVLNWKNTLPFTNEEVNTCKYFQGSKALRKDIIQGGEPFNPEKIFSDRQRADLERTRRRSKWARPYSISTIGEPKIRGEHDWIFLDGYILNWVKIAQGETSKLPEFKSFGFGQTFVLRLHDLYDGISQMLSMNDKTGGFNQRPAEEPDELRRTTSQRYNTRKGVYTYQMNHILGKIVEPNQRGRTLKILVGEVPDDVRPCDLEEIIVPSDPETFGINHHADKIEPPDDEKRMRCLAAELDAWMGLHLAWVYSFFEADNYFVKGYLVGGHVAH